MEEEYSDIEYAYWAIMLADENCDYFGPHFNKFSGIVMRGEYGRVLNYARNHIPRFKGWGEGYLKKVTVQTLHI